jgi:hypothetical protein
MPTGRAYKVEREKCLGFFSVMAMEAELEVDFIVCINMFNRNQ